MTTEQRIALYQEALLRWLRAKRDYPGLFNPEPEWTQYGLGEWEAKKIKASVELEFRRTA